MQKLDQVYHQQMDNTAVGTVNAYLSVWNATFAKINVIELIGCFNVNVLYQDRFISYDVDLNMNLMPFADSFLFQVGSAWWKCGDTEFKTYY